MNSAATEAIFRMVARRELTSAQALALITNLNVAHTESNSKPDDIAIIGIAGRFPGAAGPAQFWDNLAKGSVSITEVPSDRWDAARFYDPRPGQSGKTNCKWAGFLSDIDKFDSLFFNISPKEAEFMDPQQRLFLETAWAALEDAGTPEAQLSNSRCGVFVGAGAGDYAQSMLAAGVLPDAYAFMGNSPSILASRISYLLNLKGPAIAIDTACSSSLVALHLACESIASGTSDLAIAGGVCILTTPNFFIAASKAGMLSPSGQCRAFDRAADGFVPGEAVGAVVLKPLMQALKQGDFIYAVVKGSAINQDGRTNGITAPSATSQAMVETTAYQRAGCSAATIGHIEAHGTGTKLGDPIEVEALANAFQAHTSERQFCSIGSVKSNIGHTMTAAGIAGLIKVLLAIKNRQLPPAAGYDRQNDAIGFEHTPFYVSRELQPWRPVGGCSLLRAAISSFGFSGTNAHIVIEEAPDSQRAWVPRPAHLIPVSAKSDSSLRARLCDLKEWIEGRGASCELDEISYSLSTGRGHFERRAAIVVSSKHELVKHLRAATEENNWAGWFVSGKPAPNLNCKLGGSTEIATLRTLAGAYSKGENTDWSRLYSKPTPRRVPLPTYPFERRSFWFKPLAAARMTSVAHPLLGRALPEAKGPAFAISLRRSDPFLRDHVVNGRSILPGVCYLEMACAASRVSNPEQFVVSRAKWLTPLEVDDHGAEAILHLGRRNDTTKFEARSGNVVYCTGYIERLAGAAASSPAIELSAVRTRCRRTFEPESLYQMFSSAGVLCGPSCQGIQSLSVGEKEALSEIAHNEPNETYTLHPTLMDAAFQTAMALLSASVSAGPVNILVPYSIEEVRVFRTPPQQCFAWVRATELNPSIARFDMDILDSEGSICVSVKDLCAKEFSTPEQTAANRQLTYYKPFWARAESVSMLSGAPVETPLVVFHPPCDFGFSRVLPAAFAPRSVIAVHLGSAFRKLEPAVVEIDHRNESDYERILLDFPNAEEVIFCGLQEFFARTDLDRLESVQEIGALSLLRLIKAIPTGRPLALKVIANNVHRITASDRIFPFTGAIAGLAKTVARELSQVRLSSIEISKEDFERNQDLLLRLLRAESGGRPGEEIAFRDGYRYARRLRCIDLPVPVSDELPLRKEGVYLIVGGLGGIGLTLARYFASKWQARLLVIGRSELDSSKRRSIEELERHGATVMYRCGDVTDLDAMKAVISEAKRIWGGVHGVIHSAIVLKDRSIHRVDEATFREVMAPKARGVAVLQNALSGEDLDFFVFFSSANSVFGNAGQSNYAAASTFEDTFALYLKHVEGVPAKVINWGYWGDVGVVSSREHQERINKLGVGSIGQNEGIQAFEAVLASAAEQLMPIKIDQDLFSKLGINVVHESTAGVYEAIAERVEKRALESRSILDRAGPVFECIDRYARSLLVNFFEGMGLLQPGAAHSKSHLKKELKLLPKYERLLDAFIEILCREGIFTMRNDRFVVNASATRDTTAGDDTRNEIRTRVASESPDLLPFLALLDMCFVSYDEILCGARPATDVLFSGAFMARVERLYKDNAISDYYNGLVAEGVHAGIKAIRRRLSTADRLRILEIGAGTGGTTARVLEKTQNNRDILDFWYTDLSPKFVDHGRRTYGNRYDFLRFAVLDIERSPADQAFEERSFDIVLGSNVLHATTDVANAVKHATALMKPGGLLILNEATAVRDFSTLTFGLTDGWWLYQDIQRRLPNSPLLDLRHWRDILGTAGIIKFRAFPHGVSGRPQSVIIGELDEAVEEIKSGATPTRTIHEGPRNGGASPAAVHSMTHSSIERVIETQLATALNLSPADIRCDKPFVEYGVDSIIGIDLINEVNNRLGTDLKTTVLFDYCTIRDLARYISSEYASITAARCEANVESEPKDERSLRGVLEGLAAGKLSADRALSMTRLRREELAQVSHEL
ncbi:MAG: SDR family NAD(P)-dependent oxidoreductase [Acidobacteriaceae bacterium]|nr:SDR family NAD(P)-dependent oxidoreductase [Acidobacteriaceae bacterium]